MSNDPTTEPRRVDDTLPALVGSLRADLAQARETNQRLQRRCHAAEALVAKFKLVEGRPQAEQGRSFGRALANYAASLYMRERDEARACLREALKCIQAGEAPWGEDFDRWKKATEDDPANAPAHLPPASGGKVPPDVGTSGGAA
jgi:hypothetical protein